MASFDLSRDPLSDHFGFDRGTPVDRRYIEAFLHERRSLVRGSVLEVQDNTYTMAFGANDVTDSVVVDIDPANRDADLVADLERLGTLPPNSFDCIILTQVLHLLRHPDRCIVNCFAAMRPGGALLVTAPSVSRISPSYPDADFWRFTPAGLGELFDRHWSGEVKVEGFGNLRTCIAFLRGEAAEELPVEAIDDRDPRFPLTVGAEAIKRNPSGTSR